MWCRETYDEIKFLKNSELYHVEEEFYSKY